MKNIRVKNPIYMSPFTLRTEEHGQIIGMKKQQKLSGEINKQYGMQHPTHRTTTN